MKSLHVASPSLCSLREFSEALLPAWNSGILTHNGPLVQQLEAAIASLLGVPSYVAVTSGTIALQLALQALDLEGDIIIPAFSWIATPAACNWEGCRVKFCDIDPFTLNICMDSLERSIDSNTQAIMPVHVFGNPCNVDAIDVIAARYHLKVIYDSAHAFGSTYNTQSVLNYGDISCVSTHATKIFNTGEGGGVVSKDTKLISRIKRLRFFGYDDNKLVVDKGINGKMTEIHAALGIANLRYFSKTLTHRSVLAETYRKELSHRSGIRLQKTLNGTNHSYFPVIFDKVHQLDACVSELNEKNIYPRRYFSPSLEQIGCLSTSAPSSDIFHSASIAERIICLPIHNLVSQDDALSVSNIVNSVIN
tara:strand:+ start:974 stop:2065 length:1092 start_codon:yes stop_codon:yes gene_type:complete